MEYVFPVDTLASEADTRMQEFGGSGEPFGSGVVGDDCATFGRADHVDGEKIEMKVIFWE